MIAGLLGAGTIGYGVCALADAAEGIRIKKVLDRRDIPGLEDRLTRDINDILDDPEIDTVVELLGGIEPSRGWIISALNAGKNVVTANKLMLSLHLPEIMDCARKNGVCLRFSAAVGGGIPFLFNIIRARRADEITEVGGILNGTTNYMLDLMQRDGIGFDAALRLAQEAGYAEADPTADVSGGDAGCKIMLASCMAWDGMASRNDVLCEGIENTSAADIAVIRKNGYALKLLARAAKADGRICCYVEPTLVRETSVEANIALVENMAYLRGANAGLQRFTGAGAGRYATAYAVINDLMDISLNRDAFTFSVRETPLTIDNSLERHRYLVRGLDVEGRAVGGGAAVTEEMSVSEMHSLVRGAREAGKSVFFAGIRD